MALTQVPSAMLGSEAQFMGYKNRLVNGGMNIWQRGTSFTNTANSFQYTADRWFVFSGVGLPATISQVATGLQNFPYALRVQRPNGNTSTSNTTANQVIETVNCRDLAGQTITVSFWARAGANYSPTGNALGAWIATGSGTDQGAANMVNAAWTNHLWSSQTVTLSASWQQFSVTFNVPAGTNELAVMFITYPTGTAGANDYFDVTGVQLEKAPSATAFDFRDIGDELRMCQRYYEKSYDQSTAPGASTQNGLFMATTTTAGINTVATANFAVEKRVAPTMAVYSGQGTSNKLSVYDSAAGFAEYSTLQVVPVHAVTSRSAMLRWSNGSSSGYVSWGYQWTASAEL